MAAVPSAYVAKYANGWWWYWKIRCGRPASASFQPPAYQAHETPAALSRSPIVGSVRLGTRWRGSEICAGCGVFTVNAVLMM